MSTQSLPVNTTLDYVKFRRFNWHTVFIIRRNVCRFFHRNYEKEVKNSVKLRNIVYLFKQGTLYSFTFIFIIIMSILNRYYTP